MSIRVRSVVGAAAMVIMATSCGSDGVSSETVPQLPGRVTVPPEEPPVSTGQTVPPVPATTLPPPPTLPPSPYADRLPTFDVARPPSPLQMGLPVDGTQAAHLSRIETADPVAFITIDDGYVRHPEALALIRDSGVPVTLFLISSVAAEDPKFFSDIREQADATIQAHTVTHSRLKGRSYEAQRQEICGSADQLQGLFGTRPTLFRAPGGLQDPNTLAAAHDCGMKAVFFWREAVNDGRVQFQEGTRIQRGDVILMHFRETFVDDYLAALQSIEDAGLTPARLEDYLG